MASAGSAIGLGSLWRFPYIAGENGGGAFVLLYLLFTLIIGLPLFMTELVIGRHSQKSAVLAYSKLSKKSMNWRLLGYLNIITVFITLSFYSVVSGWCLNYALMSLTQFSLGKTPQAIRAIFDLVAQSSDINIFWLILFILLNVGVVYSGIRKGIEYWSRILTPALFLLLLVLLGYSATLQGFSKAVQFILFPDFSKLSPQGVLNALGMALFTLSVGMGIILTYGSYLKEEEDIPKTGFIVAIMTVLVSLLAALMIFPVVFTFHFNPEGGPGLVFQTLPILFAKLPGTLVLSTLFFILLVFAALTSSISLFEMLVSNLMELKGWSRHKSVIATAFGILLFGVPCALSSSGALFPKWQAIYGKNFFDTMNYVTGSWMMPIAALFTTLFLGWFVDKTLALNEFSKGTAYTKLSHPWLFLVKWIIPAIIILIILQEAKIIM